MSDNPQVIFHLDYDGTLDSPGSTARDPFLNSLFTRFGHRCIVNTAQSQDYFKHVAKQNGIKNYSAECGDYMSYNGKQVFVQPRPEIKAMIDRMRRCIDGLPCETYVNKKNHGYAVRLNESVNEHCDRRILDHMETEIVRQCGTYKIVKSAGYYDLQHCEMSKGKALKNYNKTFFTGIETFPVMIGDTIATDGEGMDAAVELGGRGVMVGKRYKDHETLESVAQVRTLLAWFFEQV